MTNKASDYLNSEYIKFALWYIYIAIAVISAGLLLLHAFQTSFSIICFTVIETHLAFKIHRLWRYELSKNTQAASEFII